MTNSQKYFLMAAEELNITRAAKRAFISQQCLSRHIKRLEEHCGKPLFHRKPRLALTPAGEALALTLRQIQMLEHSLEHQLQDIEDGANAVLRIGLHSWRAQAILPLLLPDFQRRYPALQLQIYSGVAQEMERMVLRGQLDLFIAHYPRATVKIRDVHLMDEPLFLVITDRLLKQYFPHAYPQCVAALRDGADIADFSEVPFVLPLESSNMHAAMGRFFADKGIRPRCALQTNITEMHSLFTAMDYGASFCPASMLHLLRREDGGNRLHIFPINGFDQHYRIALAYLDGTYLPRYMTDFIQLTRELFAGSRLSGTAG